MTLVAGRRVPDVDACVQPGLGCPTHVGIIMDGNGRWAKRRGLPRLAGHHAGTENVRRITIACADAGVDSADHLRVLDRELAAPRRRGARPDALLAQRIDHEAAELHRNNVQIRHIGTLEGIQPRAGRAGPRGRRAHARQHAA